MSSTFSIGSRLWTLAWVALTSSGCLYGRIAYYNAPTLDAPSMFASRVVHASKAPRPFSHSAREAVFPLTRDERVRYGSLAGLLEAAHTRAFVVIHDDAIVYERYFHGVSSDTELPGFSMSKTYAAALIGRALHDGRIGSLDESLVSYLPELANKPGYPAVTLEQLLRMTTGIDFDEEAIDSAKLYYTYDLRDYMYSYDVTRRPGQYYLYGSVNVQLLWAVLQRRLGAKSVSQYFEEQMWQPLGATHAASWSLDSADSGIEKLFGGFNATARDHARLGLLFLHGGSMNGRELLSKEWVEQALTPDPIAGWVRTSDKLVRRGLYQWFLTLDGRAFFAKGYNGQYIFVVPERRAVFVRFGEGYGGVDWTSFFLRLADNL